MQEKAGAAAYEAAFADVEKFAADDGPPYIKPYSPEWWSARRGKITASKRLHTVLYGTLAAKNKMLDELDAELADGFTWPAEAQGAALSWGKDHETQARNLIEMMYDVKTYEPGFLCHPEVPILAATPDYGISTDGGKTTEITGEIKAPYLQKNHTVLYLQGLKSNRKYETQVQGQILVTGAHEGWFSSFDPRAPHPLRLSREIIQPDEKLHTQMLEGCVKIASMLKSDSRFGRGKVTTPSGVRRCF